MKRIVESTHLPLRMSSYGSTFQEMMLTPPTPMMRMSTPARQGCHADDSGQTDGQTDGRMLGRWSLGCP
jgi:hypothetical protein